MNIVTESPAAVNPETEIEKQEAKVDLLYRLLVMRAKAMAASDQATGASHDASSLWQACGAHDLMFALHRLYTAERSRIITEVAIPDECRAEVQ